MADQMMPGTLYVCRFEVKLKGNLSDGRPAFSLVPEGSPVIPVVGSEGAESILIDGAVVPYSWRSESWKWIFQEAEHA